MPRAVQELRSRVMRCETELGSALGRRPTPAELARELQVGEDDVARALRARPSGAEPDEATPDGLDDSDERLVLASAFEALDERERQIVYLRFVQDLSRKHVAQKLRISERHLSRQTQVALAKLREQLEGGGEGAARQTPELVRRQSERTQAPSSVRREASPKHPGPGHTAPTRPARAAALRRFLGLPYHISVALEGSRWTASVDELPGCVGRGDNPEEAVPSRQGSDGGTGSQTRLPRGGQSLAASGVEATADGCSCACRNPSITVGASGGEPAGKPEQLRSQARSRGPSACPAARRPGRVRDPLTVKRAPCVTRMRNPSGPAVPVRRFRRNGREPVRGGYCRNCRSDPADLGVVAGVVAAVGRERPGERALMRTALLPAAARRPHPPPAPPAGSRRAGRRRRCRPAPR